MPYAIISTLLWLIVIFGLIYFSVVRLGLRYHGRGKTNNVFGTTANKIDKMWRGWFALGLVVMVVAHGWWYLLYPFRQLLGGG